MEFDFDEARSEANRRKHGIDFESPQVLWLDDRLIEIPARTRDEPRLLVVGMIEKQHWSAVITYRDDRVRLIPCADPGPRRSRCMSTKAEDFDRKFDRGEDVSEHLDVSKARRVRQEQRRVNVDFPVWMIESLDLEAKRLGVTRQSVIKMWIADRLDRKTS